MMYRHSFTAKAALCRGAHFLVMSLVLLACCLAAPPGHAAYPGFAGKIRNPQVGHPMIEMGKAVAVDGDTMVAGAPDTSPNELPGAGVARVYRADGLGGWTVEAELVASDAAANEAVYPAPPVAPVDLRYAETTVNNDYDQLKLIGWGGQKKAEGQRRKDKFMTSRRSFRPSSFCLHPSEGGPWSDAGMAIESEITISNQERGKEWEYRVLAVNKAGEGEPSNTVMAVL